MRKKDLCDIDQLMTKACLKVDELAARWCLQVDTLNQWRWIGCGPSFLKVGRCVAYRMKDIEKFERAGARGGNNLSMDQLVSLKTNFENNLQEKSTMN